jgi:flagellar hook-basal body complex protein FliE
MAFNPIAAIGAESPIEGQAAVSGARGASPSFAQMMLDGVSSVDAKVRSADSAVTAFALDDSIPPHQVMFALEEAHHAMSMMMQVRARVVEGYQELMRMQL